MPLDLQMLRGDASAFRSRAALAIGTSIAGFSLVMMAGWLARSRSIVQFLPGFVMVFNTALCFTLSGLALAADALPEPARRRTQTVLGITVAAIGGMVLTQYLFGADYGIDWARLHEWLADPNPLPGRMAAATCLTFVAAGVAIAGLHNARTPVQVILIRSLTGFVAAVSVLATGGYLLELADLIENYWFTRMSLPTAVGFGVLAAGLWSAWEGEQWHRPWRSRPQDERIVLLGALVLAVAVAASGIAGFRFLQAGLEEAFSRNLVLALKGRAALFATVVERDVERAADLARRPAIHRFYRALAKNPADAQSRAFLQVSADTSVKAGLTAYEFLDDKGRVIARAGTFLADSGLRLPLRSPHEVSLLWDRGFLMQLETDVTDGVTVIGRIRTEQRVPEIDRMNTEIADLGQSGEIGWCRDAGAVMHCMPTRFRPQSFNAPRMVRGQRVPMTYALAGLTGTVKSVDYRGKRVLAAYMPVSDLGIGAVMKIDLTELYAPVRRQLAYLAPALALLLGVAIWVLHASVRPLTKRLAASERRLRLALEAASLVLWDCDIVRGKVTLSDQWQRIVGGAPGPVETTLVQLAALVHPDDREKVLSKVRALVKGEIDHYDIDHRVRTLSGEWKWIRSRGEVIERSSDGRAVRALGINTDVTALKEQEALLSHRATHDALTGLPNRELFFDRLARAMLRAQRERRLMGVMYLDIDRFKQINDGLGHALGDALLKEFAQRLLHCMRASDTVARLGGDEFLVILEGLAHPEDGIHVAGNIVAAMQAEFVIEGERLEATTSAGLVLHPGDSGVTADELVRRADEALYRAKAAGRNRYCVYGGSPPQAPATPA